MKKKLAVLLTLCLVIGSLAGCGSSAGSSAPAESAPTAGADTSAAASDAAQAVEEAVAEAADGDMAGKKVGFSPVMMSSEFFAGMSNQMKEYFEANGMIYSDADADASVETQTKNIENFVQMGMDYIILILSRLVDTFSSRILHPMQPLPGNYNIAVA